jgi:thiamine-monophosphate kinase
MSPRNDPRKKTRSRVTVTRHVLNLGEIGEFGLLSRIRKWMTPLNPAVIKSIGDDAAVIKRGDKVLLVTTDILIEDIHFKQAWIDPYHLGKKALAVNLSDIAAMGGIPEYCLISLGLPEHLSLTHITSFYRGLRDEARRFRVDLIGGDTSLSQKMIINICLLGNGQKGDLLFRNGARIGDDLFVTGTLGDASLGLKILQKRGGRGGPRKLIEKHLSPHPRIELAQTIARHHFATSMIDVSDGLLIDASHVLEESQVGARIWEDRIPLSGSYRKWIRSFSKNSLQIALSGGEDYELLFTASPEMRKRVADVARSSKTRISRIGEILPRKEGLLVVRRNGKEYSPSPLGFEHFKS